MMRRWFGLLLATALASEAQAQQVPNPNAEVSVARPAYARNKGPRVAVDEAHRNFHTVDGRYGAFAALLRNDGYRVAKSQAPFTAAGLRGADVLVIANAEAPEGGTSAFTAAEIEAVKAWVNAGGALLLIADHKPFAGAAAKLGEAFGVAFTDAYVSDLDQEPDVFTRQTGLGDHPITRGRGGDPAVSAIRNFTGSSFRAPAAQPLITLPRGYVLVEPAQARAGVDPSTLPSAEGMLQGAALRVGKGRVAVMAEAAMFSSQLQGPEKRPMGWGAPGAEQNQQFVLNLLHWLTRRRGY